MVNLGVSSESFIRSFITCLICLILRKVDGMRAKVIGENFLIDICQSVSLKKKRSICFSVYFYNVMR